MALKQKIVRKVGSNIPEEEIWHLICFFSKYSNIGSIARRAYYRVYEFRAASSEEAKKVALKQLKRLASRLVGAEFFVIMLNGGSYGSKTRPGSSYLNCCAVSDAMRNPKNVLKVRDTSKIFVMQEDFVPLIRR